MMIRKRGNVWQAVVFLGTDEHGKKRQKSFTADTQKEARRLASAEEFRKAKAPRLSTSGTVGQLLDEWLAYRRPALRGTTISSHGTCLGKLEPIHAVKLRDLSPQILTALWGDLGTQLAPSTVVRVRAVLRAALAWAVDEGRLDRNPCRRGELSVGDPRVFAPSLEQVAAFMQAADPFSRDFARFLIVTGCRIGEACALTWDDVDGSTVTFSKTVTLDAAGHQIIGTTTKTGRSRQVFVDEETMSIIRRHSNSTVGSRILFPPKYGLSFSRPNTVTRAFTKIWAEVAPARKFSSAHGFRHFAASQLMDQGVPPSAIRDRLGWTSAALLDRYSHGTSAADEGAAKIMANLLGGRVQGRVQTTD